MNFWETGGGRWILDNAARFGFSLSYPEGLSAVTGYGSEPWHYRYLGRAGTKLERRFFGGVQQVFRIHYCALLPALKRHADYPGRARRCESAGQVTSGRHSWHVRVLNPHNGAADDEVEVRRSERLPATGR